MVKQRQGRSDYFHLTTYGGEVGRPFAALSLLMSERHDRSLETIWGVSKGSNQLRPPETRLRIVEALLEENDLGLNEVEHRSGISQTVVQLQARSMSGDGVITYTAENRAAKSLRYQLIDDDLASRVISRQNKLAVDYLSTHQSATVEEVAQYCWSQLTEQEQQSKGYQAFRQNIATSLREYKEGGYLRAEGERGAAEPLHLSDAQAVMWRDVIEDLELFLLLDHRERQDLVRAGLQLLADQERARAAFERVHDVSKGFLAAKRGKIGLLALSLVGEGEELTIREISDRIEQVDGRTFSAYGLREAIRKAIAQDPGSGVAIHARRGMLYFTRQATVTSID